MGAMSADEAKYHLTMGMVSCELWTIAQKSAGWEMAFDAACCFRSHHRYIKFDDCVPVSRAEIDSVHADAHLTSCMHQGRGPWGNRGVFF